MRMHGTLAELEGALEEKLTPFKTHLSNAKWQGQQFHLTKDNVPENWVVLCLDRGELQLSLPR